MSGPVDKPPSSSNQSLESLRQAADSIKTLVSNDSGVARAMESMRQNMDEIGRLSKFAMPRVDLGISSHWAKIVEEQNRRWREITQPIERLRSGLLIENEFTRFAAAHQDNLKSLATPYGRFSESLRSSLESIQSTLAASVASQKILLQGFDEARMQRLEELAKPFQLANSFAASALAESIKLTMGRLEIAQHFRLPAFDPIATAALVDIWGSGDLQVRIRLVSEELQRSLQEEEPAERANVPGGATTAGAKPLFWGLDFWTIFNIVLALTMLAYQEWSSSQMEARLSGKIENGDAAIQKQIAGLQTLLVQAMSAKQPWEMGQTQFVARARVARIRRDPTPGSPIVAEVFPNQVVAMLSERGKWIHVEYYDWFAEEKRQGWALKKYFVRVRPLDPSQTDGENED